MAYIDYYDILGIDKNASPQDIRRAYRKQAKKYHPDLNKDDPHAKERFQAINEANEVLSDPDKRKKYDEYGENWKHAEEFEAQRQQYKAREGGGGYNTFGGYDFGGYNGASGFSDFFEELFGTNFARHSSREQRMRGHDLHSTLTLPLKEVIHTEKRIITIDGRNIRISIPAGIADGQKIRLRGQGGASPTGERGDLYITFHIEPEKGYTRHGDDLHTTLTTDLYTALLGGEVMLRTLDDSNLRIRIKAGTQPDSKLRLQGQGLPAYKDETKHGDLIITIKVKIPTLNEEGKELIRQIRDKQHQYTKE